MSLLSHLGATDSPVRAFFASRLANTDPVVRAVAAQLRDGRKAAPLAAPPGVNPGRAGTAVDYLVRFGLAREPCPRGGGGAAIGAGMLEGRLVPSARDAVQSALEFVHATAAFECEVSSREWEDLARIALLFAVFEQCFRTGILPDQFESVAGVPSGWREWADLACVQAEVEDVAVLGYAAVEDHGELRGRKLLCNPVFAQSVALGGADADLITDGGMLVDFKSTSTTRTCSTTDIWQLCGYTLADTNDEFAIRLVGLSALRWRTQWSCPLDELLPALAGMPASLDQLRQDFAAVLSEQATRHGDARPRRRETREDGARSLSLGPEIDEQGQMVWSCSVCGETGVAREGAPIKRPGGGSIVEVLLPPKWRRVKGQPTCPACRYG